MNCDIEGNSSVLCGIFMTFRIHLLPPYSGSADERGGGSRYKLPGPGVRGQNMLHFLILFLAGPPLLGGVKKVLSAGPKPSMALHSGTKLLM